MSNLDKFRPGFKSNKNEESKKSSEAVEPRSEKFPPYDYQMEAADKTVESLTKTGRALIDMATGLGKTRTAIEVIERIKPKRILVLADNKTLLADHETTFGVYLEGYTRGFYTGEDKRGADADIVFATRQTMREQKKNFPPDHFDLVLDDESHHAMATTYVETLRYFTPKWLMGMTATPDRTDWKDIREIFGPPSISYTLAEGMRNGWLTKVDYRLVMQNVDVDELNKLLLEQGTGFDTDEINERIFKKKNLEENLRHMVENVGDRQTAIMCESIDEAEQAAFLLRSWGYSAEGFHTESEDDEALKRFRQKSTQFVTAVNMMNEGIDVPELGAVAFLRPTDSKRIFLQQLGRVLRKHPDKETALVLDYVGSVERLDIINSIMREIRSNSRHSEAKERFLDTTELGGDNVFTFDQRVIERIGEILERNERRYGTYAEAKQKVHALKLKNRSEYFTLRKTQHGLPTNPEKAFGDEFEGWNKYLGIELNLKPFNNTKTYKTIREKSIRTENLYQVWSKLIFSRGGTLPSLEEYKKRGNSMKPKLRTFEQQADEDPGLFGVLDSLYPYIDEVFRDTSSWKVKATGHSTYEMSDSDLEGAIQELRDWCQGNRESVFSLSTNSKSSPLQEEQACKTMRHILTSLQGAGLLTKEFFAPDIYDLFCEMLTADFAEESTAVTPPPTGSTQGYSSHISPG